MEADQRIDLFLHSHLNVSRVRIQEMIKSSKVTVNNQKVKAHHKVKQGEIITFYPLELNEGVISPTDILPQPISIEILYMDSDIIMVNKPAGMVTHLTHKIHFNTLVNALLAQTTLCKIGLPFRPGIVHRLDKDTSGVIVVARTEAAYYSLVEQFGKKRMKRLYLAIVYGKVKELEGRIAVPIGWIRTGGVRKEIHGRKAREAITNFKVLERTSDYSFLELSLETGRTHQIRLHLSHIGYPVIGDSIYGRKKDGTSLISRQALHAYLLGIHHPTTGKYVEFTTHLPDDMKLFLQQHGFSNFVGE